MCGYPDVETCVFKSSQTMNRTFGRDADSSATSICPKARLMNSVHTVCLILAYSCPAAPVGAPTRAVAGDGFAVAALCARV